MVKQSKSELRKKEIIMTTMSLMAEKGIDGASTVLVAKKMNVSQGLIHYHFKNKQEILISVIEHISEILMLRYNSLISNDSTNIEKINAFISARLSKGKGENQEAVSAWIAISAKAITDVKIRDAYSYALDSQSSLLLGLIRETNLVESEDDIKNKVSALITYIEGAFFLSIASKGILIEGNSVFVAKSIIGI
jgi:TetR/AcrR family transcriptional repressor of bet genes